MMFFRFVSPRPKRQFCVKIERAMAGKDKTKIRWVARSMYINEHRTQAEIAEAFGLSRQTVVRWSKEDKWAEYKASITMTRDEQIKNWQRQIIEINQGIMDRQKGQRFATPGEADTILKLTTAINKLETEAGIHEIVGVGQRFIAWLRAVDFDKTKEFVRLFDAFIQSQL